MVNTFLPVADFKYAAKLLDNARLGKQRVEGRQIVDTLCNKKSGWSNHPIVRSWRGYETALKYYVNCIIDEWVARGNNNDLDKYVIDDMSTVIRPWWCDWDRLHINHRAMLLLKNPARYKKLFIGELSVPSEYLVHGYIWPYKIYADMVDLPLSDIAEPLAKILQNPRYCTAVYISGYYIGELCSGIVKSKDPNVHLCGIHLKKSKDKDVKDLKNLKDLKNTYIPFYQYPGYYYM